MSLLRHGANRDVQDDKSQTPLFLAAREGSGQVAQLLLQNFANADIADHMDCLPRDVAADRLHRDIVQLFDDYGSMGGGQQAGGGMLVPPYTLQKVKHKKSRKHKIASVEADVENLNFAHQLLPKMIPPHQGLEKSLRKGRRKKNPDAFDLGRSTIPLNSLGSPPMHDQTMDMPPPYEHACFGRAQYVHLSAAAPNGGYGNLGESTEEDLVFPLNWSLEGSQKQEPEGCLTSDMSSQMLWSDPEAMMNLLDANMRAQNQRVRNETTTASYSHSPQNGPSSADSGIGQMQSPINGPGSAYSNISQTQSPLGGPSSAYSSGGTSLSPLGGPGSAKSNAQSPPNSGTIFCVQGNGSGQGGGAYQWAGLVQSPVGAAICGESPSDQFHIAYSNPVGQQSQGGGSVNTMSASQVFRGVALSPAYVQALHQRILQNRNPSSSGKATNQKLRPIPQQSNGWAEFNQSYEFPTNSDHRVEFMKIEQKNSPPSRPQLAFQREQSSMGTAHFHYDVQPTQTSHASSFYPAQPQQNSPESQAREEHYPTPSPDSPDQWSRSLDDPFKTDWTEPMNFSDLDATAHAVNAIKSEPPYFI